MAEGCEGLTVWRKARELAAETQCLLNGYIARIGLPESCKLSGRPNWLTD